MWSRRDILRLGLASWAVAGLPRSAWAQKGGTSPTTFTGPRYVVTIFLRGGIDAIYTTDPKLKSEVGPKVDLPYGEDEIVTAGDMRLGPHFKDLSPWASRMAIVRGVQVKTANHESGALQILRLKTAVSLKTPGILDIVGSQRDGQPLGNVILGKTSSLEHSPKNFGAPTYGSKQTIMNEIDKLNTADFRVLKEAFQRHLQRVKGWSPTSERTSTEENIAQVSALFNKLPSVPTFQVKKWGAGPNQQTLAEDLQRTLWLLEHDLTRTVYLKIFYDWDSHFRNAAKQTNSNGNFVRMFSKFLKDLHSRKNEYGRLADNTLIVVGSELGRFPILNGNLGKDHFPETSFLFFGPNINTGAAYGPTGQMMEGKKVSTRTGAETSVGGHHLTLDDIGTTVLRMVGMNPEVYGYRGKNLEFLARS